MNPRARRGLIKSAIGTAIIIPSISFLQIGMGSRALWFLLPLSLWIVLSISASHDITLARKKDRQ